MKKHSFCCFAGLILSFLPFQNISAQGGGPERNFNLDLHLSPATDGSLSQRAKDFYSSLMHGNIAVARAYFSKIYKTADYDGTPLVDNEIKMWSDPSIRSMSAPTSPLEVTFQGKPAYLLTVYCFVENETGKGGGMITNIWFQEDGMWKVAFPKDFHVIMKLVSYAGVSTE